MELDDILLKQKLTLVIFRSYRPEDQFLVYVEKRRKTCISLSLFSRTTMDQLTCTSEYCNAGWSEVLTHMSPYGYANFGIAFGLGLSVVGAAWGIWLTGSSLVGAAVKAPRIRSKNLIRYVESY